MDYPHLEIRTGEGGVATVVIDRPEVRNAVNTETLGSLSRAFTDLSADGAVRAVVLRGRGEKAFCAGADLKEWQGREGVAAYRMHFDAVARAIESIARCSKPTVAAVDGFALAGGCGLAAVCDITLCTKRSQFGLPEIQIGLIPAIVMAPIFRAVGRKKGVEMVLRGRRLSGEEAECFGLATRCVSDDALEAETAKVAAELASLSPYTLRVTKEALSQLSDMEFFASLRYLREVVASASMSEDAREGVAAFFEKRPPRWKGR